MLLINDDKANFATQRAQRYACSHHEVWSDFLQPGVSIEPLTLTRP